MDRIVSCWFFVFLVLCGCTRHQKSDLTTFHTPKKMIMIDAGHGGKDPGAVNTKLGYEEKSLTLDTAKMVCFYLQDRGYHVHLTRTDDTYLPLSDRANMANKMSADLFVSIHYNYTKDPSVQGLEVFYYQENTPRKEQSVTLAKEISQRLVSYTQAKTRGIKKGNFAVIRETSMPAVLVEIGFLSHPEERKKIQNEKYRSSCAYAIAEAIDRYFIEELN